MILSGEDRGFIAMMRSRGVLKDDDPTKIDTSKGLIVVCCSDGDQMLDLVGHTCELFKAADDTPRLHMFANHGGAMLLGPDNEAYEDFSPRDFLLKEIADARAMKNIHTILLTVHAPCGCASNVGDSIVRVVHHMMLAKKFIKGDTIRGLRGVKVVCALHVDHGNNRRRTYHIRASDWFGEDGFYEYYETTVMGRGDREHDEREPLGVLDGDVDPLDAEELAPSTPAHLHSVPSHA